MEMHNLFRLTRTVLIIRNGATRFINGLTVNTPDAPQNAFVDLYGRSIAVIDQVKLNEEEILLILAPQFLERLLTHLKPYRRLAKITIETEKWNVYFDVSNGYKPEKGEHTIPQKSGQMLLTKKEIPAALSDEAFTLFRLRHGIPLQGIDYGDEMLLNIDEILVSFTKGCFLGQEVLARVHNRARPPKKLVVKAEDECTEEEKRKMTSKCFDSEAKKVYGFVFVKNW